MLGDDPIWSVECSHGREKAGGVGLRALIKAFFLILATVAVLEVGHADFSANWPSGWPQWPKYRKRPYLGPEGPISDTFRPQRNLFDYLALHWTMFI